MYYNACIIYARSMYYINRLYKRFILHKALRTGIEQKKFVEKI